jgi:hypothetical protein
LLYNIYCCNSLNNIHSDWHNCNSICESKVIAVTGREDPEDLLDNQLVDGGEVFNLTHRSRFTPQEDLWCSFLLEGGKFRQIGKKVEMNGDRAVIFRL